MTRLAVGLCALSLVACDSLLSFDVHSSGQTTIPAGASTGLLGNIPGFGNFGNMTLSQDQSFQNNNTNKDHISQCHLTKLTLKVLSPTGADLSFLSKIDFYIAAPNLPKVHIAGKSSLPVGASSVDLDVDDRDIAAYAKSDSFSITTEATGHSPSNETTVEADLTLNVHASLL